MGKTAFSKSVCLMLFFAGKRSDGLWALWWAIKEKGLKIPQDIALLGFSNWFFGELMEPSLTSIDQPGFEMGQEAARLLIRQIELKDKEDFEPQPETKVLKTRLVIRNSSLKKQAKKK
jgi:LacI family transcriptional regulator